jgi:hypothetical protein
MNPQNLYKMINIKDELAGAYVSDRRQIPSLCEIGHRINDHPELSYSAATGSTLRKAGSNIFADEEVDILAGHQAETLKRGEKEPVLLVIQDTTDLNFRNHKETTGLGQLGGRGNVLGICSHTALVATADGLPLGLLGQYNWAPLSGTSWYRDITKIPIEEKETYCWLMVGDWVEQRMIPHYEGKIYRIGDREGEFYEHFAAFRSERHKILTRAKYLQRIVEYNGVRTPLGEVGAKLTVIAKKTITVQRKDKKPERTADLELSIAKIILPAPQQHKGGKSVALNLVFVTEPNPPKGEDPIEWWLLTDDEVETADDALFILHLYTRRWIIERFHFVIKQNLRIEALQFDSFTKLSNAFHLYGIIGWRILHTMYLARYQPDESAAQYFDNQDITILEAVTKRKITTNKQYLQALGKLVNFEPSKRQPLVGEKLLGQALNILANIRKGTQLNL